MRKIKPLLIILLAIACSDKIFAADSTSLAELARQESHCGEWQKAIDHYSEALAETPRNASLLAKRAYAYSNIGKFKQAFCDYNSAIQYDAKCPDIYSLRSVAYSWLGIKKLSDDDAQKALKLFSDTHADLYSLSEHARLLYRNERYKESAKEFKQILEQLRGAKDFASLLLAARSNYGLKQYDDAIRYCEQALKLSPDSVYVRTIRGSVYGAKNKWLLALNDLNYCTNASNEDTSNFARRGYAYYNLQKTQKAIADFDQAINLEQKNAFALTWRGHCLHDLSKNKKAIADFDTVIKIDPSNASAYSYRADNYCHLREWQKALKDTRKAVSIDPNYAEAYIIQGWVEHNLKNFPQEINCYDKAISINPNNERAYYNRGMAFHEHKDYRKAIDDLTKAINLKPKNAIDFKYKHAISDCNISLKPNSPKTHPHLSRGIAYARLGDYKSALADFDESIKVYPEYGEAYYERAKIYKNLKMNDLGKEDFAKAEKFGFKNPEAM